MEQGRNRAIHAIQWSRGVEQRSRVEQRSGVEQRSIEIRAKAAEEYKVRVYLLCFPQLV